MPIIVFASPKGGAGKTTAAVILASEIARKRARVAIIDGDPRQRITRWAQKGSCPENFLIASGITEETIIDEIERCGQSAPFVIVDLEGTASLTVAYAISRADLVLIPSQGSQMDAEDAVDAIRLVRKQERAFRRKIPYAVLLTKTSAAIRPRTLRHVITQLARIIHENSHVSQWLASYPAGPRITRKARSVKNIAAGVLHDRCLEWRNNVGQIFPWSLGPARSADVKPILYCPANSLIPKASVCSNPRLMNYPG